MPLLDCMSEEQEKLIIWRTIQFCSVAYVYRLENGGNKLLTNLYMSAMRLGLISSISSSVSVRYEKWYNHFVESLSTSESETSWWRWLAQTYRDAHHLASHSQQVQYVDFVI